MSHRNFRGSVGCLSLGRFGLFRLGVGGVVVSGGCGVVGFILGVRVEVEVEVLICILVQAIVIVIGKVMVWIGI